MAGGGGVCGREVMFWGGGMDVSDMAAEWIVCIVSEDMAETGSLRCAMERWWSGSEFPQGLVRRGAPSRPSMGGFLVEGGGNLRVGMPVS